ncbi:glycosyltransferase family 2 protein [archaeon]|nr:MAG: glycosyltransferase family 2 protein [archaeon]
MLPKVSVIVLTYNGSDVISTCLDSVIGTNYPKNMLEIIVVDNKSTDNTVEVVKRFKDVRLIRLDKNYGFAEGNNRGAAAAKGEYVVFLSQDAKVTKTWLEELIKCIYGKPGIGAACSVSLYYDNKKRINSAGGFWSVLGVSGSIGDITYTPQNVPRYVFFPSGVSFIMRKDVFRKIGGLDTDYFLYVEDTDLGWRTWDAGYKVVVCPSSIMYHRKEMFGTRSPRYYFFNTKNRLLTIAKDAPLHIALPMLASSVAIHLIQASIFAVKGKPSHAVETLKGILWLFTHLGTVASKRHAWKYRSGKAVGMMYGLRDSLDIISKKTSKHFR